MILHQTDRFMKSHSFAQSMHLMLNVLLRSSILFKQWLVDLFTRAYQGRMSMTHCLFFVFTTNAVYFAFWEWLVIVTNLHNYIRYDYIFFPATFFIMVCIWQCSANIQARFTRFVVRLLLFIMGVTYLMYASMLLGIITNDVPSGVVVEKRTYV